jgi:hypothetical protein
MNKICANCIKRSKNNKINNKTSTKKATFIDGPIIFSYTLLPPITLNRMAITASTNKIWISPPMLYTNAPKIQPITRIIAII